MSMSDTRDEEKDRNKDQRCLAAKTPKIQELKLTVLKIYYDTGNIIVLNSIMYNVNSALVCTQKGR
jgi:hypothetical protein